MKRGIVTVIIPAVMCAALVVVVLFGTSNPTIRIQIKLHDALIVFGIMLYVVIGVSLIVHLWNVRVRKRAVTQAHQVAAEDRRRFLQRLDHELKNPLTAIRAGMANFNDMQAVPIGNGRQDALNTVMAQTVRLSRLAADLRKLADLETRPLEHAPVDMGELLREIIAVAQERPEAAERRLMLTLPQAPWPLPIVNGDHDLLFLALHNLVDNALKFTQPGDTVEVRAFENEQSIVIEVADTGPGVPDAEQEFVWQELYRGHATRAVSGTGLGMALVRAVVARHNGQASLRSRLGQGTVVTVRLPGLVTER